MAPRRSGRGYPKEHRNVRISANAQRIVNNHTTSTTAMENIDIFDWKATTKHRVCNSTKIQYRSIQFSSPFHRVLFQNSILEMDVANEVEPLHWDQFSRCLNFKTVSLLEEVKKGNMEKGMVNFVWTGYLLHCTFGYLNLWNSIANTKPKVGTNYFLFRNKTDVDILPQHSRQAQNVEIWTFRTKKLEVISEIENELWKCLQIQQFWLLQVWK
jgi:hypothetical protein